MYCFGADVLVKEATLEAEQLLVLAPKFTLILLVPGVRLLFGWKIAAFAVLGDSMDDFGGGVPPLGARVDDGVNAGESTLKRFFMLWLVRAH